ncbi:MAG: glycoside hydrolase family 31 protein [bacterium]|nr:glycoside hydrolase family 31 protein [bacterium]
MFGKLLEYRVAGQKILLTFENRSARIEVITSNIINVFAGFQSDTHDSRAIEGEKLVPCSIKVIREEEALVIKTEDVIVKVYDEFKVDFYNIDGQPISLEYRGKRTPLYHVPESMKKFLQQEGHTFDINETENYAIQCVRSLDKKDAIYGLGDKTGVLNKRYYEYEMWNTDNPDPHEDSFKALYKSIPFFITLKEEGVYGIFFDNHNKTYFDMGKESEDYYVFGSEAGNLDYYFFAGEHMADIIKEYTYLTGRMPLPQLWTLGYHQSRWGYETEEEVRRIAKTMRKNKIPCDCIHLDIDYMDHYKVFSWNKETYEDPKRLINDLKEMGYKIVTIIDPGVKVEKGYDVYEEGIKKDYFVKDRDGNVYVNQVWPGDSVFPDFGKKEVRDWWAEKQQFLLNKGVRGVWNDMNEPASFKGPLPDDVQFTDEDHMSTHKEMHNLYGHNMAKATFKGLKKYDRRRPFVITRACYSGSQKYALGWTGDNQSLWGHLRLSVVQLCNSGLSGFPFMGTDIGGFGSDTTKELLTRWVQVGCFSPFFRNHCAKGRSDQEPWVFGEETMNIYRKFVNLRYQLIPYLYDTFRIAEQTGIPMFRPLVLQYEKDEKVKNMNDQFMVGEQLLVAPVLEQGATARLVYLPEGGWYDYETKEYHEGNRYIMKEAPLDCCPMFVKEGTILPTFPVRDYIGETKDEELILKVFGTNGRYVHYQDNGEDFAYRDGEYNEYEFLLENGTVTTNMLHHNYKDYQKIEVEQ